MSVPRQHSEKAITVDTQTMKISSSVAVGGTFITRFLLKMVANQLLSFIESITMIVHMFILSLSYPLHV